MNQCARPTFGDEARTLEVHLFGFDGTLYGERVRVQWVARLRDVRRFKAPGNDQIRRIGAGKHRKREPNQFLDVH